MDMNFFNEIKDHLFSPQTFSLLLTEAYITLNCEILTKPLNQELN